MVGVIDGEYLCVTPSFAPSFPLRPEYLGVSNLPSSILKWRWPCPGRGAWPTVWPLRWKSFSATFTVMVLGVLAPFCGVTNLTSPFGVLGGACWAPEAPVLPALSSEDPPQPISAAPARNPRAVVVSLIMALPSPRPARFPRDRAP